MDMFSRYSPPALTSAPDLEKKSDQVFYQIDPRFIHLGLDETSGFAEKLTHFNRDQQGEIVDVMTIFSQQIKRVINEPANVCTTYLTDFLNDERLLSSIHEYSHITATVEMVKGHLLNLYTAKDRYENDDDKNSAALDSKPEHITRYLSAALNAISGNSYDDINNYFSLVSYWPKDASIKTLEKITDHEVSSSERLQAFNELIRGAYALNPHYVQSVIKMFEILEFENPDAFDEINGDNMRFKALLTLIESGYGKKIDTTPILTEYAMGVIAYGAEDDINYFSQVVRELAGRIQILSDSLEEFTDRSLGEVKRLNKKDELYVHGYSEDDTVDSWGDYLVEKISKSGLIVGAESLGSFVENYLSDYESILAQLDSPFTSEKSPNTKAIIDWVHNNTFGASVHEVKHRLATMNKLFEVHVYSEILSFIHETLTYEQLSVLLHNSDNFEAIVLKNNKGYNHDFRFEDDYITDELSHYTVMEFLNSVTLTQDMTKNEIFNESIIDRLRDPDVLEVILDAHSRASKEDFTMGLFKNFLQRHDFDEVIDILTRVYSLPKDCIPFDFILERRGIIGVINTSKKGVAALTRENDIVAYVKFRMQTDDVLSNDVRELLRSTSQKDDIRIGTIKGLSPFEMREKEEEVSALYSKSELLISETLNSQLREYLDSTFESYLADNNFYRFDSLLGVFGGEHYYPTSIMRKALEKIQNNRQALYEFAYEVENSDLRARWPRSFFEVLLESDFISNITLAQKLDSFNGVDIFDITKVYEEDHDYISVLESLDAAGQLGAITETPKMRRIADLSFEELTRYPHRMSDLMVRVICEHPNPPKSVRYLMISTGISTSHHDLLLQEGKTSDLDNGVINDLLALKRGDTSAMLERSLLNLDDDSYAWIEYGWRRLLRGGPKRSMFSSEFLHEKLVEISLGDRRNLPRSCFLYLIKYEASEHDALEHLLSCRDNFEAVSNFEIALQYIRGNGIDTNLEVMRSMGIDTRIAERLYSVFGVHIDDAITDLVLKIYRGELSPAEMKVYGITVQGEAGLLQSMQKLEKIKAQLANDECSPEYILKSPLRITFARKYVRQESSSWGMSDQGSFEAVLRNQIGVSEEVTALNPAYRESGTLYVKKLGVESSFEHSEQFIARYEVLMNAVKKALELTESKEPLTIMSERMEVKKDMVMQSVQEQLSQLDVRLNNPNDTKISIKSYPYAKKNLERSLARLKEINLRSVLDFEKTLLF